MSRFLHCEPCPALRLAVTSLSKARIVPEFYAPGAPRCSLNCAAAPRQWSRAWSRNGAVVVAAAASGDGDSSLYSLLGVPVGASQSDIKRAYRRLALKLHPDVNKEPGAQEKFMRIKQAYQTLIDTSSRSKYDRARSSGSGKSGRREDDSFYGLDDFFRDLQTELEMSASSASPKSIWQELAEIGEEFLEFLEKDLNLQPEDDAGGSRTTQDESRSESRTNPDESRTIESDIEDVIAELKRELGLQ